MSKLKDDNHRTSQPNEIALIFLTKFSVLIPSLEELSELHCLYIGLYVIFSGVWYFYYSWAFRKHESNSLSKLFHQWYNFRIGPSFYDYQHYFRINTIISQLKLSFYEKQHFFKTNTIISGLSFKHSLSYSNSSINIFKQFSFRNHLASCQLDIRKID